MDTTDINSGGAVTDPSQNPSNGLDIGSLMSQLIGTAGQAYAANQQASAQEASAQAFAAAPASAPLAFFSTSSGRQWLIVGAGILALALILRR